MWLKHFSFLSSLCSVLQWPRAPMTSPCTWALSSRWSCAWSSLWWWRSSSTGRTTVTLTPTSSTPLPSTVGSSQSASRLHAKVRPPTGSRYKYELVWNGVCEVGSVNEYINAKLQKCVYIFRYILDPGLNQNFFVNILFIFVYVCGKYLAIHRFIYLCCFTFVTFFSVVFFLLFSVFTYTCSVCVNSTYVCICTYLCMYTCRLYYVFVCMSVCTSCIQMFVLMWGTQTTCSPSRDQTIKMHVVVNGGQTMSHREAIIRPRLYFLY